MGDIPAVPAREAARHRHRTGDTVQTQERQTMVDYIGIANIQKMVGALGPAVFIEGLAAEIEADYRRWGNLTSPPATPFIHRWVSSS